MSLFPGLITRNWQLKASAFGLAVLLWTVPELGEESRQVMENVPVRVQLNDPQWALVEAPLPEVVRVTLTGPTRDLLALGLDRPSIVIPVDQVSSPDTAVLLRFPWVRMSVGENVKVEELNPSVVNLSFEAIAVAGVPLVPRFQGELPEDLSLAMTPEVTPALTRVSGPRSRVESLESLDLQPLNLSRVAASGSFSRSVDTVGLGGLTFAPQEALVSMVVEERVQRTVEEVPIQIPSTLGGLQVLTRPASASVVLTGARSLVEGVDTTGIRVSFSRAAAESLSPGEEARVSLSVEGVPNLVQAHMEPEWVLIRRPTGQ